MAKTDIEIIVDDPTAPEGQFDRRWTQHAHGRNRRLPAAVGAGAGARLRQLAHRHRLGFHLRARSRVIFRSICRVILGGASLYGLAVTWLKRREPSGDLRQARRAIAPPGAVFVPTLLFCLAMQFLGLYVASFLLIAGFMRMVGRIALWKSLVTALVFTERSCS